MRKAYNTGFTLIELMVVVVIIGLLAGIAMPAYQDYSKSSRAQEATGNLMAMKTAAEQWFADNKTYTGYPCATPANAVNFAYACSGLGDDTFTITATGTANIIAGWTYTIDQDGVKTSAGIDGSSNAACWITKASGSCS